MIIFRQFEWFSTENGIENREIINKLSRGKAPEVLRGKASFSLMKNLRFSNFPDSKQSFDELNLNEINNNLEIGNIQ